MNERIKELMAEADRKCSETRGIYDEILAELIVRECIQAVKNVGGYNEDYHMNAIKKYFGVEE